MYNKGIAKEDRFFKALKFRTNATPAWFLKPKWAPVVFDAQGIDFIVYIRNLQNSERIAVPVQVKSSHENALLFLDEHPHFVKAHGVLIIVLDNCTDDEIRADAYVRLEAVREAEYTYKEYLAMIANFGALDHGAKKRLGWLMKSIKDARTQARRNEKADP